MIINEENVMENLEKTIVDRQAYQIFKNKNGDAVLKINLYGLQFFLHSKYNPVKQGEAFADAHYSRHENIILYGLGFSYHVLPIIRQLKENQTLYILECNLAVVKLAFAYTDIKQYLQKENVVLFVSENLEPIKVHFKKILMLPNSSFILYEPSLKTIPEHILSFKDMLEGYVLRVKSNQTFSQTLEDNHNYNITKGYENGGRVFFDKYKNKSAIIVSAGPSLRINGHLLKKVPTGFTVIAVGRSAKFFEEIGGSPDFYVESDGQNFVHSHLDIQNQAVPLFILSTADKHFEQYKGKKYILFEKIGGDPDEKKYCVDAGGSVATIATSLAQLMGFTTIIYVGQDLCYTENATHYDTPFSYEAQKNGKWVLGMDGKQYYTTMPLYQYLIWIERFILQHPEITFMNATAKGAKINGAREVDLEKIMSER